MHGLLVRSRRSTALLYALSAPCVQWRIAALQACRNAAEELDLTSRMCIQTMAVHVVDLPMVPQLDMPAWHAACVTHAGST